MVRLAGIVVLLATLLLGACAAGEAGLATTSPTTSGGSVPAPSPVCDQSVPAPPADAAETYAIHQDLDANYGHSYFRSEPVSVCGKNSMVILYAVPSDGRAASSRIDVRAYNSTAGRWDLVATFDPHEKPDAQPYLPADNASCRGACVAQADITDGDVDFLVQGENSTLANGLSVISVRSGQWRMVPFLDKPPATSSNPYVPAAELVDQDIRVSLDDLSVTYRYDPIQQAFAGAIADPTPTPTPAPSPVTSPSSEPGPTVSVTSFYSPSRNILCGVSFGQINCFITERNFAAPACDIGQPGFTLVLNATGSTLVSGCAFDSSIKYAQEAGVVTYGTTVDFGVGTCAVSEQGVRCVNSDGHGFTLARAGHTEF